MKADALPYDLLLVAFRFLGSASDISSCARVCRSFHKVSMDQSLWEELANRKYGSIVVEKTKHLYDNDYHKMVIDDNVRGAMPTFHGARPSYWKYNGNRSLSRYYCCLVMCIKWNRSEGTIRVYIDVRGESDLRDPRRSTIETGQRETRRVFRGTWTSELDGPYTRGHYKGYLSFPASQFDSPGTYTFTYADCRRVNNTHTVPMQQRSYADYIGISVLKVPEGQSLQEVCSESPLRSYTVDESPFEGDNEKIEKRRWLKVFPQEVLENPGSRLSRGPWWV